MVVFGVSRHDGRERKMKMKKVGMRISYPQIFAERPAGRTYVTHVNLLVLVWFYETSA
jgi:hypothetical protein